MTHTSGPWTVISGDRFWNKVMSSTNRLIVLVQRNYAFGKVPAEEAEGNAALMAAAPELLEACKAVVAVSIDEIRCTWCNRASNWGGHENWCPIPQVIAAIAKVESPQ